MRLLAGALCLLLMTAGVHPSRTDQTDARLDDLFAALHQTGDGALGAELTARIWQIWFETDDTEAAALLQAGESAMAERRFTEALSAFNKLVERAPNFAEGWNRRATLYYLMGQYAKSAVDVKRTLELEPRHFGAMSGLGLLYLALEKYAAAREAFEDALEMNPHLDGPRQNIELIRRRQQGAAI